MRTAPAFQLCPRPCSGWTAGTAGLFLACMAVSLAWAGQTSGGTPLLGAAGALLTLGCAVWLRRGMASKPASLRWDGQFWHWGPSDTVGGEPFSGQASVCIDTGAFMLLHLQPGQGQSRAAWLPLSRRGMAAEWHLLRCALHAAPGPGAGPDAMS